ncbi:prepilin peptidase [Fontimonas sp. SYSU GA230001]|uniref:A24 family peptidase n=1 Tax=Fontimonas sp. SYSU GA230001 TaxID=3142450 RepID=UPI0032B43CE6
MTTPAIHPLLVLSLLLILVIAVRGDLRERRIPNWLSLGGIGVGAGLQFMLHGTAGLSAALYGALLGGLLLLPLWLLRGMAAGDVKLMAAVGTHLGPVAAVVATMATLLVGGIVALILWWRHHAARASQPGRGPATFPYAPAIAAGSVLTLSLPLLRRLVAG